MMNDDWRYSEDRMVLRQQCLGILLNKYGRTKIEDETYSTQDIYEFVDTWVSQGNQLSKRIVLYFNTYFNHENKKSNQVLPQTS